MKILYAANNAESSKIQLYRFFNAISSEHHIVKFAAYKKSSPNINIDWTLDCLLDTYKPNYILLNNDNFSIYFDQVKKFAPDLIISDLEFFTSYIANVLNINIWQCSSALINLALPHEEKYNLGIFKNYSYLLKKNTIDVNATLNVIASANQNFVYSHFCDTTNPPKLNDNFQWIRPYHSIGKISIPCKHNIIGITWQNNKKLISVLKNYKDSIVFSNSFHENYTNLKIKDISNAEEYYCNLKNSNLLACEGNTSFLADAFYNNKYSAIFTNFQENECIINSFLSKKLDLGSMIFDNSIDLNVLSNINVMPQINPNIKFLHEKINDLS